MKIILSGGGSGEKSIEMDKLFASLVNKSKPLLYVPIAIDKIKHPYPECLKWLRSTFDKFGVNIYEMWAEEDILKFKLTKPDKFGGIYIGGGNTFYLLKLLREGGFLEFLRKAIKIDIPIYGGSAAAIIFGKSILTSLDENFIGLTNFSGMNLLKDTGIFCHYKPKKEKKIEEMLKKFHFNKIIALSEETGIYIHDNKARIIGKEPAFLFFGKEKIKINVGKRIPKVFIHGLL